MLYGSLVVYDYPIGRFLLTVIRRNLMRHFFFTLFFLLTSSNAKTVLAQDTITAVTSEGKEVLLNLTDNTWKYAASVTVKPSVLYQDDLVRFIYEGSELRETRHSFIPSYKIYVTLAAVKPTEILRYQTHKSFTLADGSHGRYQTVVNEITDNFGNTYEVCSVDIDGEKAAFRDTSEGIFFGEPKRLTIGICGKILKVATTFNLSINSRILDSIETPTLNFTVPINHE